ncbi:glycosyltransferase family 39 protein [Pseudarthrobacter oxydans]|uniref:glycosyltransferase family 39 protein n=1 Tax=Pseudarthrobacter oxydans TaxID=1671 RepID=UPI0034469AC8
MANNGWGNPYYAAAAQSGASDLESYFFGSADAGKGLTVDKPPLHLWILGLSVKLFGLSYLSVLVPQALMGMATVLLVHRTVAIYGTVRQAFLAGLFLILTPVTTIIFRFNNPDALLLLLWALAAFFFVKSVHKQSDWAWLFCASSFRAGSSSPRLPLPFYFSVLAISYLGLGGWPAPQ